MKFVPFKDTVYFVASNALEGPLYIQETEDRYTLEADCRGTPKDLIAECAERAGVSHFDWDMAATPSNAVCKNFWSLGTGQDSLDGEQTWPNGHKWLNPPFSKMAPWFQQCWRMAYRSSGIIACISPSYRTEQPYFQRYVETPRQNRVMGFKTIFLPGRRGFLDSRGQVILNSKGKPAAGRFGLMLNIWNCYGTLKACPLESLLR